MTGAESTLDRHTSVRVGIAVWRRIGINFWLRRLLKAFLTVFFVASATFFMARLMPANPIDAYISQLITEYGMSYDEAQSQAASLFSIDLDSPLHIQYLDYLNNLLHGNLGYSILSTGTPVSSIIIKFLPWTIFSVGLALVISFTIGVLLGMLMAYRRESLFDHALSAFASLFSSVPNYLVGMMLLVFVGVQLNLLPVAAMRGSLSPGVRPAFNLEFVADALFHAALPVFTYVLTTVGGWMLTMKSSTLGTLEEDYVTFARARGLRDRRIATAYVGRNAILPLFTQLTISLGFVVGGSPLIESIFVYQGIGLVLWNSISSRDYPVMQGVFLVITVTVVMANLFTDLLYGVLDPRIKVEGRG